jgi:predicted flap endonuclease-1-like 5' DNA nuclease
MRLKRNSGAVLVETGMFAAMVGVVAATLMMVLFAMTILLAAMIGGVVAAVVFVAMWLMMLGTLEPARGPGNIPRNKIPSKPLSTPSAKTTVPKAKPAAPKAKAPAPKPAPAAAKPAADVEPAAAGTAPATLTTARDGAPDDLKQIKGVGPKLEKQLHSMGFYHFDQIASWTADEVAWVDENMTGFNGRVTRDDWVAQAKALANDA